ncbi:MAG: sulfotransferase family protein, partial [Desulfobacteraceae bacterium]|nr:sulfotransferase family protein [Desulfobacteraceae bacterium]
NFEYAINISLKHKYIYVETPKVGCSTIKDTLQRMELDYPELVRDSIEEIHLREYSPLLRPSQTCGLDRLLLDPDYFVFCFARNPYTRLLSAYLDKIVKNADQKRNILIAMGEDPSELSKEISFKEFVDTVCEQSVSQMNPHWRVQYYQTIQDKINYDFIGRMENFENDCTYVFSKIRRDYADYYRSELRHSTNSAELLNQFYDGNLKEKVFNKYKIDFEYFGYSKNQILTS